jgi:hypothetical protein
MHARLCINPNCGIPNTPQGKRPSASDRSTFTPNIRDQPYGVWKYVVGRESIGSVAGLLAGCTSNSNLVDVSVAENVDKIEYNVRTQVIGATYVKRGTWSHSSP